MQKSNYRKCSAIFLMKKADSRNSDVELSKQQECICTTDASGVMVFAGERCDIPGAWQIPQGGVEENETHLCAAIRELREETNITNIKLLKNTNSLYRYDFPEWIVERNKNLFHEGFVGQEVRFFLFKFLGNDVEISVDNCCCREFTRWRWMKIDHLIDGIVEFKRNAYAAAASELGIYAKI